MRRWLTAFVCGFLLTAGHGLCAEEEDPFAETIPPVAIQPQTTITPRPPLPSEPVLMTPVPHRITPAVEPTLAQQRVHERAAQEALARKARIEQRRHGSQPATHAFFPSESWRVDQSLYPIDPGIRVAFRPLELSGLAPIPSVKSPVRSQPKRVTPRATPPQSKHAPRE